MVETVGAVPAAKRERGQGLFFLHWQGLAVVLGVNPPRTSATLSNAATSKYLVPGKSHGRLSQSLGMLEFSEYYSFH